MQLCKHECLSKQIGSRHIHAAQATRLATRSRHGIPCSASRRDSPHKKTDKNIEIFSKKLVAGAVAAALLTTYLPSTAIADEAELTAPSEVSEETRRTGVVEKEKLQGVDDNFQKSDTLKRLLEQSANNKEANRQKVANKYCYRQAELGIGDCGGLQYIPGMTDRGKQRTPDWLMKLLGREPMPADTTNGMTLESLLGKPE